MHRQKGEKILMNDRENDNRIKDEGRQVQQELEDQLRAFGDTMTDAFAHGFEGRGMEIGDRAYDVGRAAVHAANYGIGEAGRAFRKSWGEARQNWAKQTFNEGYAEADTSGMPGWVVKSCAMVTSPLAPAFSTAVHRSLVTVLPWACAFI